MSIYILAEHNNQQLSASTKHVVAAAQQLNQDIIVVVAGFQCDEVATQAANLEKVSRVIQADAECYANGLAENCAALLVSLKDNFNYLLAPATTYGKNILPRVAALLDVGQLSDVLKIVSADTFVRPIYAGNVLATVQTNEKFKLLTIRTTHFPEATTQNMQAPIEKINTRFDNGRSQFVKLEESANERPELTSARVIIAGGRGLQSKENFKLLEKIADQLHAAIGASRAAVDAGFVPNDYQVGQTGKIVAPDLYIAIGISGAIQHLAGMKDSKVIVAINKDPDAAIFQVADYGLVGDLFQILPELESKLTKL